MSGGKLTAEGKTHVSHPALLVSWVPIWATEDSRASPSDIRLVSFTQCPHVHYSADVKILGTMYIELDKRIVTRVKKLTLPWRGPYLKQNQKSVKHL